MALVTSDHFQSVLENLESYMLMSGSVCVSGPMVLDISSMKSHKFKISKEGTVIFKIEKENLSYFISVIFTY